MNVYNEYGKSLENLIRPNSHPLAVRMLRSPDEVPDEALRPVRDFGKCMSTCQIFALSRRFGETVAQLFEDMWCPEPVIGFGLQDAPEYFMDGNNRYPRDVSSPEAGRVYAKELPKLPTGLYSGIMSAALHSTPFEPEIITIYCVPAQLSTLLLGHEYKDGHNLNCALSSHAACVYGVVPTLLNNRAQVAIPCRGDRYAAMAEDDEMILSLTPAEFQELMTALRYLETTGTRYPQGYRLRFEYPLPKAYEKIADMMGYLR